MTIRAQLFDGTILEFPEGTSQEVVAKAARQQTALLQKQKKPAPPVDKYKNAPAVVDQRTSSGFFDRVGDLLDKGGQAAQAGVSRVLAAGARSIGADGIADVYAEDARQRERIAAEAIPDETSFDEVKGNWLKAPKFIAEQALVSAPAMLQAAVPGFGIGATAVSQTGSIGQRRAENNGRDEATLGDLAKAAPAAVASAALERIGIKGIGSAAGKTAGRRVGGAAAKEAGTEFLQSGIEYTGGTLGTDKGFEASEALDQAAAGGLTGAGLGGGIRGGIEIVDSSGRLINNSTRRPVADGATERAVGDAALTDEDIASPLDNDTILAGKVATAQADGNAIADKILSSAAMPMTGQTVVINNDGVITQGIVSDAFEEGDARGIVVTLPNGQIMRENFDDLADANVTITPMDDIEGMLAQADAIDAQLADDAAAAGINGEQLAPQLNPAPAPLAEPAAVAPAVTGDNAVAGFMRKTRRAESGGNNNAKNPNSSATGVYQFIEGTFKAVYKQVYGGGDAAANAAWANNRNDPAIQEKLMLRLTKDNAASLKAAGVPVTEGNLYLAHFAGEAGARALHKNPNASVESVLGAAVVNANSFLKGKSAQGVIDWAAKKMGGPAPAGSAIGLPDSAPLTVDDSRIDFGDGPRRAPLEPIAARAQDRVDTIATATGREVGVKYAVVEARDLKPSNRADGTVNPDYPADRQPRDRTRAASQNQVQKIANNLKPYWLGRSVRPDDGAPIIAPNGVVESGNGRSIALQSVYEQGGAKADEYRRFVESQGIDTEGMEQPVLVRIRQDQFSPEEERAFAREANMPTNLGMAPTEQAMADADALSPALLAQYQGGDVDSAANSGFVRQFMSQIMSPAEAAQMQRADGTPNKTAFVRIRNALLGQAYSNPLLVENVSESMDSSIVAIGGALTDVAGPWAKMIAAAKDGTIPASLDITQSLNEAVDVIDKSRREGIKVADIINQRNMFTGDTVDPVTEALLRLFFINPDFTKPAGRGRVKTALESYVKQAMEQRLDQTTLEGAEPTDDPRGLLAAARVSQGYAKDPAPVEPDTEPAQTANEPASSTGERPQRDGGNRDEPSGESLPQDGGEETAGDVAPPAKATKSPEELGREDAKRNFTGGAPDVFTAEQREEWQRGFDANKGDAPPPGEVEPSLSEKDSPAILDRAERARQVAELASRRNDVTVQGDILAGPRTAINYQTVSSDDLARAIAKIDAAPETAPVVDKTVEKSVPVAEVDAQPDANIEPKRQPGQATAPPTVVDSPVDEATSPSEPADEPVSNPDELPATSADMAGTPIDDEWMAFADDSGTLDIPRAEMPQIKAENRGAMVNFLNARGIAHEEVTVPATDLKPTQREFSPKKVEKAKAYEGGNLAILISKDDHVLDGHHQWLAARDSGEEVRAIRLDAPIRQLLDVVPEMPSVETADGDMLGGATRAAQTYEPVELTPGAYKPFDDPGEGTGVTSQIDSMEHDLRAVVGRYGTLTVGDDVGDGTRVLVYQPYDKAKSESNIFMSLGDDGTADISIDGLEATENLNLKTANRFGPAEVRDALRQIAKLFPELRSVGGERWSGAGPGRTQKIGMPFRREELEVTPQPDAAQNLIGDRALSEIEKLADTKNDNGKFVVLRAAYSGLFDILPENYNRWLIERGYVEKSGNVDNELAITKKGRVALAGIGDRIDRNYANSVMSMLAKYSDGAKRNLNAPDMFGGAIDVEKRQALERKAEGAKGSDADQKPVGSDGGLFDTRGQNELFSRTDEPVAVLTGSELGKLPPEGKARMLMLRSRAFQYYIENMQGRTIVASDGREIIFSKQGGKKSTSQKGDILLRAIPAIEALIKNGKVSDVPARGDRAMKAQMFSGTVIIDGQPRVLGAIVRTDANGTRHYDLTFSKDFRADPLAEASSALKSVPEIEFDIGSDINLFILDERSNNKVSGQVDQSELAARLQQLGLSDKVALQVVDTLNGAAGSFRPAERLITVARNAPQDGLFTLEHETVHALRDMGMFTKSEWLALSGRARSDLDLMKSIKRRYPDLNAEAQVEEAVADLFARWAKGRREKGVVGKVFDRIRDMLGAIRNALGGAASARSAMRDIDAGKIGGERIASDAQNGEIVKESRIAATQSLLDLAGTDPTWKGKMADRFERFRMVTQDRYITLRKTQRIIERAFGAPIPDNMDVYKGEELVHGRIAERLDRLQDKVVRPILDAMAAAQITIDEFESYLYARHAPERNAQIAKINDQMPDGGSGMTNIAAAAIMKRIAQSPKAAAMTQLAKRVDDLREMTINNQVEYGLISADRAAELRATYKFYVPLRGFKELETQARPAGPNRSGGGINVRGPEGKRAFGRRSEADSPLSYLIMQAEEAISRGETNRVAQEFYELAKASPDGDFWTVQKVQYKRRISPNTGMVEDYPVTQLTAEDAPYTVIAKVDGKERRVTMNKENAGATRLADAMRRLTDSQLDWITKNIGVVNRWLSAVNTRFNPEFVITNLFRDLQTAAINLQGVDVDGLTKKTVGHYKGAMAASMRGSFDKGKGDWGKWYDEFVLAGAKTAFARIDDIETVKSNIEKEFAAANSRAGNDKSSILKLKIMGSKAKDLVENVNDGVENSIRLAVYRSAREMGQSEKQAASIAKNITVNFNRRGQMGPAINSLYLFYNASVQGNVRIAQAIYHSPKVRKIVAVVAIAGLASELLNALVSDDDEDGESFYDKIPAFEKERNIIIMHPDGKNYTKIPMPWGYNVFWETGRIIAEVTRRGGDRAAQSGLQLLTTYLGAFNPIGFSWEGRSAQEIIVSAIMPTPVDPVVDLSQNVDFSGRPIMPEESQFGPQDPDAQRFWPGVDKKWKAVTDAMTEATGGNVVEAGHLDVSPETVEYLVNTMFGAVGGFVDRIVSLPEKMLTGEATVNDFPMVRKVVGKKSPYADKSAFFERMKEVEARVDDGKDYLGAEMMEELDVFVKDHEAVLSLESTAKEARKITRQIRKERRGNDAALDKGTLTAAEHKANDTILDDVEQTVVTNFNREWVATVYKGGE